MKSLAIVVTGFLCIPIFLLLAPNVEQSREEARTAQAYHDVQQLSRQIGGTSPAVGPLSETDPWGLHYQISAVSQHHVRVLSCGSSMSSPPFGIDDDDIYSDMPVSPLTPFQNRRMKQLALAVTATLTPWLLVIICLLRSSGEKR